MDISYFKEISKFRNVTYYDTGHFYYIGDKQVISVTGLIERFKTKFDTEEKLKKYGKKADEIREEWLYKNRHAVYEGRLVHRFLENRMMNKVMDDDDGGNEHLKYNDVKDTYLIMKVQANSFYEKYIKTGILIPVSVELVVGSIELELAGQMDVLFYNTQVEALQVWDYKTNGKIETISQYGDRMLHCLSHLDVCEMNTYSIQTHVYRHLIMKETNLNIHLDTYIVWFNENNDDFKVIKCFDARKEVEDMLNFKNNNPDMFQPYLQEKPFDQPIKKPVSFEGLLNLENYI